MVLLQNVFGGFLFYLMHVNMGQLLDKKPAPSRENRYKEYSLPLEIKSNPAAVVSSSIRRSVSQTLA